MKVIILFTILLSGCVGSAMWEKAEKVCANNEGVDIVWHDGEVVCNNGAQFGEVALKNLNKGELE